MIADTPSLTARGVAKRYRLSAKREQAATLAESILGRLRRGRSAEEDRVFWALQDIDLDLAAGDVLGIIGRNGAGKSTLLKVLSRITAPTRGEIRIRGRVGSLLEVGTGFHPELSGRENIFLNGAVLGMTRAEVRGAFDAIVTFAGVERFLDTPVKRYSSGMYVRLAFAVAAHLRTEILIVDEVLAVGDAGFQARCLGKMGEVAGDGRIVLFVSHQMQAVHTLCNQALLLEAGRVTFRGSTDEAIRRYQLGFETTEANTGDADSRRGSGEYRFGAFTPDRPVADAAEGQGFGFTYARRKPGPPIDSMWVSCELINEAGLTVTQMDSRLHGLTFTGEAEGSGRLTFNTPWLKPGAYRVHAFLCAPGGICDIYEDAASFRVSEVLPYSHAVGEDGLRNGMVLSDFAWSQGPASAPMSAGATA